MLNFNEKVKIVVDPSKISEKPVIFTIKKKGKRVYVSASLDKDNGIIYVDAPVTGVLRKKIINISVK